MNHSKNISSAKEKVIEAVQVPKDAALGYPVLTIMGNQEVCIENYRRLLEYTQELIRIQSKTGQIKIVGVELQIEYYTNDEMKIKGTISVVEYL